MDPLTHGLVGASAALLFSDNEKTRPAAFAGALSAMSADLDIFISSQSDPLLNLEMHRQFTHSLITIPAGSLLIAAVLYWFLRNRLNFRQLYLYTFAGLFTAGLLDACTSYGTHLLWPFLDNRISWSLVSIVDPIITAGLLLFVILGIVNQEKKYGYVSAAWLLLFLTYGFIQQSRAENAIVEFASQQSHSAESLVVKPTLGNQLLWRANYKHNGRVYSNGVRTGIFSEVRIYEGESSPLIIPEQEYNELKGSTLFRDLKRFETLSDDYLVRHPKQPDVIGDARFSMLPTSMTPLWGIRLDEDNPDRHPDFLYFRDAGEDTRQEYLWMIKGE